MEKLSKAAALELYRDSLKHDYLLNSGVHWSAAPSIWFSNVCWNHSIVENARDIADVWGMKKRVCN